ncbi:LiaF domain-containing protein [Bacillus sp. SM2101]|uniref:toast rack family protein n=1 Tax=Bacillus sp. SM2101 TaxID=2805366 RepID=UPI001BDF7230
MKKTLLLSTIIVSSLILSACGNDDTAAATKKEEPEKTEVKLEVEKKDNTETEPTTEKNVENNTLIESVEREITTESTESDITTERFKINKDNAKELEVSLIQGSGDLFVSKGTHNWAEGALEYGYFDKGENDSLEAKYFRPELSFELIGDKGKINIQHDQDAFSNSPKVIKNFSLETKNIWDIDLTDEIPISLDIDTGASNTELDLRGLQLKFLGIDSGAGNINLDLSGDWDKSFDVTIDQGVGNTTVYLPTDIGVKISSSIGLGSPKFKGLNSKNNGIYVNEAYDNAEVIINLKANFGIGDKVEFIVK